MKKPRKQRKSSLKSSDYDEIKKFLALSMTSKDITKYTGWSVSVQSRVNRTTSFAEYKKLVKQSHDKYIKNEVVAPSIMQPLPINGDSNTATLNVSKQSQLIDCLKENTKEVKMLREAVWALHNKKGGWFK